MFLHQDRLVRTDTTTKAREATSKLNYISLSAYVRKAPVTAGNGPPASNRAAPGKGMPGVNMPGKGMAGVVGSRAACGSYHVVQPDLALCQYGLSDRESINRVQSPPEQLRRTCHFCAETARRPKVKLKPQRPGKHRMDTANEAPGRAP